MKALITGGRGFVGTHLTAHLLACADEVVVVDAECDVTRADQIGRALAAAQPEAIYHLAARSSVAESFQDPAAFSLVNAVGTATVLSQAAAHVPGARVLVVSSADVYGPAREDEGPVLESRPAHPVSPYAQSKLEAEGFARRAAHQGQGVLIARPFPHLGPGQSTRFVVPALAERLLKARASGASSIAVGDLSVRRDYSDVRDVVRAYRLLIEHGAPGEVYNIASSHDVALSDIAHQLAELVGVSVSWHVEASLLRPAEVAVLRGSAEKLHAATGWEPHFVLSESLIDVIRDIEARTDAS